MFEQFTDRARRVVVLALEEARLLNHDYIGTEHLLLGLVHEGEGVAAKALESLGISLETVRARVENRVGVGALARPGHIPFTSRARKVLELSLREALQLGHNYIGTEHILLGLIREGEGVGAEVLMDLGAEVSAVRTRVIQLVAGQQVRQTAQLQKEAEHRPAPQVAGFDLRAPPQSCAFCGRDVWEIGRYVAAEDSVICQECADTAHRLLTDVPEDAAPGLYLPPRVFGDPPDDDAVRGIERAVKIVFGGAPETGCAELIEDGERLTPLRAKARRLFPQITEPAVRLWRVRFVEPDDAEIRLALRIGGGPDLVVDGHANRVARRWRVSRETFCLMMRFAGIACPPPGEPGA